jgi:hypothetical protein
MAENLFPDLFRNRQRRIQAADTAVAEARRAVEQSKAGDQQRHIKRAARKSEHAAKLYQEGGLGLLAKQQFATASRLYSLCQDTERAKLNQERWSAVSTYWEEPESQ